MLAYVLAIAVGLGSFALYMAAFFFPEVHRKNDFIWSGIGLFYALVLWVCAGRITGGVLLGQTASVALLGWFGWQTLKLRRDLLPTDQQTPLPGSSELRDRLSALPLPENLSRLPEQANRLFTTVQQKVQGTSRSSFPDDLRDEPAPTIDQPPTPAEVELDDAIDEAFVDEPISAPASTPEPAIAEDQLEPATVVPPTDTPSAKPVQGMTGGRTDKPLGKVLNFFTVIKDVGQDLIKSATQKKPSKPTIVINRAEKPTSAESEPAQVDLETDDFATQTIDAVVHPATQTVEEPAVDVDADFTLEEEEDILNNEIQPDPAAIDDLVQPKTFTDVGEVASSTEATPFVDGESDPVTSDPVTTDAVEPSDQNNAIPTTDLAPVNPFSDDVTDTVLDDAVEETTAEISLPETTTAVVEPLETETDHGETAETEPDQATDQTPAVEDLAPEVELAPPAEDIGPGDPFDRQFIDEPLITDSDREATVAGEPEAVTEENSATSEVAEPGSEDYFQLKRPTPPREGFGPLVNPDE